MLSRSEPSGNLKASSDILLHVDRFWFCSLVALYGFMWLVLVSVLGGGARGWFFVVVFGFFLVLGGLGFVVVGFFCGGGGCYFSTIGDNIDR